MTIDTIRWINCANDEPGLGGRREWLTLGRTDQYQPEVDGRRGSAEVRVRRVYTDTSLDGERQNEQGLQTDVVHKGVSRR